MYLEETIYLQLEDIINTINNKSTKFVEQNISFSFDQRTRKIFSSNNKIRRFISTLVPEWVLGQAQN